NSDFIVKRQDQDIHSIMPKMPRNRIRRINEWHSSIVDGTTGTENKADIYANINRDTRLAIHAAIGQNQMEPDAGFSETPIFHYYQQALNKQPVDVVSSSDGFLFFDFPRWPKNLNGSITMPANLGPPKYIFGNLKDYYMNQDKLEISLNNGPWTTLTFGTDFGKYESRKFDHRLPYGTYNPQDFRGSLFFAPVNPTDFALGENSVRVRVNSPLGENRTVRATIINGIAVPVVETDASGQPISDGLIGQGKRLPVGASQTFYFLIDTEIQPTAPNTTLAIAGENGAIYFTNSGDDPPQSGQFRFVSTGTQNVAISGIPNRVF